MTRTLTPILSIIIAILLGIFFIQPEYDKAMATQGEINEYKKAIEQYDSFTSLLNEKLAIKNNRTPYENEQLSLLVPEEINSAQLLVDLERMAKDLNLLFGNITVTGNQGGRVRTGVSSQRAAPAAFREELQSVDIAFQVIGTYEQFKEFLRTLERSATLFEVTQISFNATEDVFQQFSVTVRTYALSQ